MQLSSNLYQRERRSSMQSENSATMSSGSSMVQAACQQCHGTSRVTQPCRGGPGYNLARPATHTAPSTQHCAKQPWQPSSKLNFPLALQELPKNGHSKAPRWAPGIVRWVLGIVSWVSGLVFWVSGILFGCLELSLGV